MISSSFHSSLPEKNDLPNNLLTAKERKLKRNQEDQVTAVIDSFENGSFYEIREKKLGHALGLNIARELDDLLLWLDRILIPCVLNDAGTYDKKKFKECYSKVNQIKQRFGKVKKFFNISKQAPRRTRICNFTCNSCKCEIAAHVPAHSDILSDLQQHHHFEEAFTHLLDNQVCSDTSDQNTVLKLLSPMAETSEPSVSENPSISTTASNCSLTENSNPIEISVQKTEEISCESPMKKEVNCSSCGLQTNHSADFKFNFQITYDPVLEKKLYTHRDTAGRLIKDIDELGVPTIQFKAKQLFTCLICCCDVPLFATREVVRQHSSGNRHVRKRITESAVSALFSYHENWKKQELKYQAHQTYFLPVNSSETLCTICEPRGVLIVYDALGNHIKSEKHKEGVLMSCQVTGKQRFYPYLLQLQAEVYLEKEEADNDYSDDSEENVAAREKGRAEDILVALKRDNSYASKKMKDQSENFQASEQRDSDDEVRFQRTLPKDDLVQRKEANTMNNASAAKNKQANHVVIKSVSNESGTELSDVLEHRFLPHLKFFLKNSQNTVECQCCKMKMNKHSVVVTEHICSRDHQANANITGVNYQFYCEICNVILRQHNRWRDHLKQPKHTNRCDRLGPSRKNKLTEYECVTCKLVIFGDDFSIKRHQAALGRGLRLRKNKEIVLSPEVKTLLKSEQHIEERSFQFVREANLVLLNQEPMIRCCRALEAALADIYPKCKVFPFGSRVSGLGNENSDLDIFVDVGDMYMGRMNQDAHHQEKFVNAACRAFRKKREEFSHVNPIPTARTPIVQVYHIHSRLDCDLSFRHGLSVENTKFLRLCIELQPIMQQMILLLKRWMEYCKLNEHITTYALSMLVIFHLQVKGYLMPVHELRQLNPDNVFVIDGWGVVDFSNSIASVHNRVVLYSGSLLDMLREFFSYYSKFNYATDVICPLLGRPIKKALFLDKPKGEDLPLEMLAYVQKVSDTDTEYFRARSPFCVQDPFDLSHNLVKACTPTAVDKLKTFCDLTFKHLAATR